MMAYIQLLRPKHWIKNLFVFAALVFSQRLLELDLLIRVAEAFVMFCAAASAVYVFNDLADRQKDAAHPRKRLRPIPSGRVSVRGAIVLGWVCMLLTIVGSLWVGRGLIVFTLGYLVLQMAYSFYLKNHAVMDVLCIAVGFVLRAMAGGTVAAVPISDWLLVCTFTLCLFLGFSKRRMELGVLASAEKPPEGATRKVLVEYTVELLNNLTSVTAGIAIMAFLLYTLELPVSNSTDAPWRHQLLYTAPLVVYGVFRFALLAERGIYDGPTELITNDRPFQLSVVAWGVLALVLIYGQPQIAGLVNWLGVQSA